MRKKRNNNSDVVPVEPIRGAIYRITKASSNEIRQSMKIACIESETIKNRNLTLMDYQHKYIIRSRKDNNDNSD